MTAEHVRLAEARTQKVPWQKWGPYLSERQWGTGREDYSEGGMPGITSPMIRPARAPIAGEKMIWPASATTTRASALRWPCGMAKTRSSRNACSD